MKCKFPIEITVDLKIFKINMNTKTVIFIHNNFTQLKQVIKIERRTNDFVNVTFIEYGGSTFKVLISLTDRKFTLYFPDFSKIDDATFLSIQVMRKIIKALAIKRSSGIFTVIKSSAKLRVRR